MLFDPSTKLYAIHIGGYDPNMVKLYHEITFIARIIYLCPLHSKFNDKNKDARGDRKIEHSEFQYANICNNRGDRQTLRLKDVTRNF